MPIQERAFLDFAISVPLRGIESHVSQLNRSCWYSKEAKVPNGHVLL